MLHFSQERKKERKKKSIHQLVRAHHEALNQKVMWDFLCHDHETWGSQGKCSNTRKKIHSPESPCFQFAAARFK
jgi:23S rRNA maturation mini-RNase III